MNQDDERTIDKTDVGVNPLPPNQRRKMLPEVIMRLLTGGKAKRGGRDDVVVVRWKGEPNIPLHVEDYELAKSIADKTYQEWISAGGKTGALNNDLKFFLRVQRAVTSDVWRMTNDQYGDKKGLIGLKDRTGCGYWRITLPSRHFDHKGWWFDITDLKVQYEYLLDYDTIMVQRLHTWGEHHVVESLKSAGKRIVYDIDDNIFDIPPDNPAAKIVNNDCKQAAAAIMSLADCITTPSAVIRDDLDERFGYGEKVRIIPNALDLSQWPLVTDDDDETAQNIGSPDNQLRVFWQGSATHAADWLCCLDGLDRVMQERDDVIVMIFGFMPPALYAMVKDRQKPYWNRKVQFMDFQHVETYIWTMKQVRAEVGLCPLRESKFNVCKSPLKFCENTVIGFPTVASNVSPYKEVIQSGVNGYLADTPDEWYKSIMALLEARESRFNMLREARKLVVEQYNISNVMPLWEEAWGVI